MPALNPWRAAKNRKTGEPSSFTMKVSDKTLAFDKNLWVQFDGVDVKETGGEVKLTARDEEAYLKVFNHFGRVLKLYIFEDGKWVDSDTGLAAKPFDELQAGHLPEAAPGMRKKSVAENKAVKKPATKKSAAAKSTQGSSGKSANASAEATKTKASAKKTKNPPPAGKKSGGKSKTTKS